MVVQSSALSVIQPVRAGDLITASLINGLIAALQDLEERVADLEAEPASPPRGPRRPTRPKNETGTVLASGTLLRETQDEISGNQGGRAVGMKPRDD